MGSAENFGLIRELAGLLGAAVGASRVVVDAEWVDQKHLIGQTGKIVRPKLYIACGISGALQHMVGVEKAECIVAINRDPTAPIFGYADYAVVGDAVKIVSALIEQLRNRVGAKSAPLKVRQLKMSCRILRLCSLAPPSLRPGAHRRGGADGKTIQSRPASEVTKSLV